MPCITCQNVATCQYFKEIPFANTTKYPLKHGKRQLTCESHKFYLEGKSITALTKHSQYCATQIRSSLSRGKIDKSVNPNYNYRIKFSGAVSLLFCNIPTLAGSKLDVPISWRQRDPNNPIPPSIFEYSAVFCTIPMPGSFTDM